MNGNYEDIHRKYELLKIALEDIAGMKIPYCDADDVAHSMRDIAKEAIENITSTKPNHE